MVMNYFEEVKGSFHEKIGMGAEWWVKKLNKFWRIFFNEVIKILKNLFNFLTHHEDPIPIYEWKDPLTESK